MSIVVNPATATSLAIGQTFTVAVDFLSSGTANAELIIAADGAYPQATAANALVLVSHTEPTLTGQVTVTDSLATTGQVILDVAVAPAGSHTITLIFQLSKRLYFFAKLTHMDNETTNTTLAPFWFVEAAAGETATGVVNLTVLEAVPTTPVYTYHCCC